MTQQPNRSVPSLMGGDDVFQLSEFRNQKLNCRIFSNWNFYASKLITAATSTGQFFHCWKLSLIFPSRRSSLEMATVTVTQVDTLWKFLRLFDIFPGHCLLACIMSQPYLTAFTLLILDAIYHSNSQQSRWKVSVYYFKAAGHCGLHSAIQMTNFYHKLN